MGEMGRSEVRSSLILLCLRMGFVRGCWGFRAVEGVEWRSRRSAVDGGLRLSTESGTGSGFGGGDQSTAVWRGP